MDHQISTVCSGRGGDIDFLPHDPVIHRGYVAQMTTACEKAYQNAVEVMEDAFRILEKTPQLDENSTEDEIAEVETAIVRAMKLLNGVIA